MHVASCACECDIEVKPCLAYPCSYTASPELLCTDLCNRVSLSLQACCASPCACAVSIEHCLSCSAQQCVPECLKVSSNKQKDAWKDTKDITSQDYYKARHLNNHADRHMTVVHNQHPFTNSSTRLHRKNNWEWLKATKHNLRWENDVISWIIFYLVSCYNSWLHVEAGQTKKKKRAHYKRFIGHHSDESSR